MQKNEKRPFASEIRHQEYEKTVDNERLRSSVGNIIRT